VHDDLGAAETVTVVIPTLNEAANIGWVLERLPGGIHEVLIVDGRSTDGTVEAALAVRPDARVVVERRPGKGAALRAGFAAATGSVVVMIDADGSMHPDEIPRLVAKVAEGYDVVKGSRFMAGGGTADISRTRAAGNLLLVALVNHRYGCRFTELCYGLMAMRRAVIPSMDLHGDGFEIETEIVLGSLRQGLRVAEVPSFEAARRAGRSNLRTFRDGGRVLREVLRHRPAAEPAVIAVAETTEAPSAVTV
jgi:glycosyltransferase involved in cell wall biosynthesis